MVKYLGIITLLVGACLLVIEGLTHQEGNFLLWFGLILVVGGYIAHILLERRLKA